MTLLLTLLTQPLHATGQVSNLLLVDGQTHALRSDPLPSSGYKVRKAAIAAWGSTTACWSGYRSVWEVEAQQLWFVGLRECHGERSLSADQALRGVSEPRIPADWYTGTLTLPQGELVHYVHGGWASTYEQQRRIDIQAGRVTRDETLRIVPPGLATLSDDWWIGPPLLVPRDFQDAEPELSKEEGGQAYWLHFIGSSPLRVLSLRVGPSEPNSTSEDTLTQTLREHLGEPSGTLHPYRDLGPRGALVWHEHQRPQVATGTYAWAVDDHVHLIELHVAPADRRELTRFAQGLAVNLR